MPPRKEPLNVETVHHVFTKTIAGFTVFNSPFDYQRMLDTVRFYSVQTPPGRLSQYLRPGINRSILWKKLGETRKIVGIIAYCIMPTHIHLIIKQIFPDGISIFMNDILKSYAHYFNLKYGRRGHLWASRFKNVPVMSEEQLLHVTRYVHLNPVSAYLVDRPQDWAWSSYSEFISAKNIEVSLCPFKDSLNIEPTRYAQFVNDRIDYQRYLNECKHLLLE